jgi:stage III sporulation protein AC
MEITLLFKVVGVGMVVAVAYQILCKAGREEQATMVSLSGMVLVLLMLMDEIAKLFATIRSLFGL